MYFYVSFPARNFDDARELCNRFALSSDLAIITSRAEMDFVFSLWNDDDALVWLGARRSPVDQLFYWLDGSPLNFTFWLPGEPNNFLGRENCLRSGRQGSVEAKRLRRKGCGGG